MLTRRQKEAIAEQIMDDFIDSWHTHTKDLMEKDREDVWKLVFKKLNTKEN